MERFLAAFRLKMAAKARVEGVDCCFELEGLCSKWAVGDAVRLRNLLEALMQHVIRLSSAGEKVVLRTSQLSCPETGRARWRFAATGSSGRVTACQQNRKKRLSAWELALGRGLAERMGGRLDCVSEVATFVAELPLGIPLARKDEELTLRDLSALHVLFVDDQRNLRDDARERLNRFGVRFEVAECGESALERLSQTDGASFTHCLLDWNMPGMDGMETIRRIRARFGGALRLSLVFCGDFSDIEDTVKEAGADMLLTKPLSQDALEEFLTL